MEFRVTKIDIYGGVPPTTIPAYNLAEASQILRLPRATLASWFLGQKTFKAVLKIADSHNRLLSFQNLVEGHVLAAVRRKHHVPLVRARRAIKDLARRFSTEHPLADKQIFTANRSIFIRELGRIIDVSEEGQIGIAEVLDPYLQRIDRDSVGAPIRLYPFVTEPPSDNKHVVVDPRVQFGRPCLARRGVPTGAIADRYKAGDGIGLLAQDYGCTSEEIEEAVRYELRVTAA